MVTLALIGLVGGLITGVSPCVLPMLPIIFFAGGTTPSPQPQPEPRPVQGPGGTDVLEVAPARKVRNRRPFAIILGLVTSFSVFTLFGSVLLSALGLPDDLLRWVGLTVLALVGIGLIVPAVGHWIEKPFYRLPKISGHNDNGFLLGLGLGTLYVPCAGPVLAAITVAGATGEVGARTVVLTISFAIGAALPLLVFATAGSNIAARIGAYRQRATTFRRIGGIVMIALAVGLAFNLTDALQRAVPAYTGGLEKKISESDAFQGALVPFETDENKDLAKCTPGSDQLASCGTAPAIRGTQQWFNTPDGRAVDLASLKGKVVLLDFWAYSCINCQRDEPHISSWYDAYQDDGLEVIGIHAPEFAFEKSASNLQAAIDKEQITYPVVQDNDLKTWTAYRNRYWPAKYLIDADGTVRAIKFGEGDYAQTESLIRELLRDADPGVELPDPVEADTQDTASAEGPLTPELYLSLFRTTGYSGTPERFGKDARDFELDPDQPQDTYSYGGRWKPGSEYFEALGDDSRMRLHYAGKDVFHVIAGEGTVTVSQDGQPDRTIQVSGEPNLYPLVENDDYGTGVITLTYSKGLRVYTYTFG
jgi:cytochrome c biogenesis protein CcdA/thiol-disulfide isomerase/thioredoxin